MPSVLITNLSTRRSSWRTIISIPPNVISHPDDTALLQRLAAEFRDRKIAQELGCEFLKGVAFFAVEQLATGATVFVKLTVLLAEPIKKFISLPEIKKHRLSPFQVIKLATMLVGPAKAGELIGSELKSPRLSQTTSRLHPAHLAAIEEQLKSLPGKLRALSTLPADEEEFVSLIFTGMPLRFKAGDNTPDGRYRFVRFLGQGGFGEVWSAVRLDHMHKTYALKFCCDPMAIPALRAEINAVVRLYEELDENEHRGMVHYVTTEFGCDPPYIVSELYECGDLTSLLQPNAPRLDIEHALQIMTPPLTVLAKAHQKGLVHRDIKPANILIGTDGLGRLADFGLAKVYAELHPSDALDQPGKTGHESLQCASKFSYAGTPLYMAPELRNATGPLSASEAMRGDVFAAGVTLVQLMAGDSRLEVSGRLPHRFLNKVKLDPAIEDALERCVSDDPAYRPADAGEMLALLSSARKTAFSQRRNADKAATPVIQAPPLLPIPEHAQPTPSTVKPKPSFTKRLLRGSCLVSVALLITVGGIVALLYRAEFQQSQEQRQRAMSRVSEVEPKYTELMHKGQDLYDQKEYAGAETAFFAAEQQGQLLVSDTDLDFEEERRWRVRTANARLGLAAASIAQGKETAAVAHIQNALKTSYFRDAAFPVVSHEGAILLQQIQDEKPISGTTSGSIKMVSSLAEKPIEQNPVETSPPAPHVPDVHPSEVAAMAMAEVEQTMKAADEAMRQQTIMLTAIQPAPATSTPHATATPQATATPLPVATPQPTPIPQNTPATAARMIAGGIKIKDTKIGSGSISRVGNTVTVHYVGKLSNGKVFDSTYSRNKPVNFRLGSSSVIRGLDYGVEGMHVGGKRNITVPPSQGYGSLGVKGVVPSNATLYFNVELLSVR